MRARLDCPAGNNERIHKVTEQNHETLPADECLVSKIGRARMSPSKRGTHPWHQGVRSFCDTKK